MNEKMKMKTKNLTLAAMFLAMGMLLPLLFGQIREIGNSLLPMHLAVMLCGYFCGGGYGALVGLILPFLRSMVFAMPPMYPNAVWMSLELATYGLVAGVLYGKFFKGKKWWIYCSLVISMLCGRVVWGIAKLTLLGFSGKSFTFAAFITGGFVDALPGIILQLLLVPALVMLTEKIRKAE